MRWLYTLSVRLYTLAINIAAPFNEKASFWVKGRKQWHQQLSAAIPPDKKCYWFHFASLGEFEQGRPIMEKMKQDIPDIFLLITFFSPSGYEIRKNYAHADYITYLPADTPGNANKLVSLVDPAAVFFIKYEFWFNYLHALKQKNIPTYLVSGIFRPQQHFFKWYGGWFRKQLGAFGHFFLQNEVSKGLLLAIGYKNATVTGDTRFDRVLEISRQKKNFPVIDAFSKGHRTFVIGSNWPKDDELLIPFINARKNNYRFIIAPHNIGDAQISSIEKRIDAKVLRYSAANEDDMKDTSVLIIDTIGLLSSIYSYGQIAYIGGGFGANVHNILEAAVYGLPTIFGPNYGKFQECIDLVAAGGAFCVRNYDELEAVFYKLSDPKIFEKASSISKGYVTDRSGATEKVLDEVVKW